VWRGVHPEGIHPEGIHPEGERGGEVMKIKKVKSKIQNYPFPQRDFNFGF